MKHANPTLAQKVYTLCYRITACQRVAASIALEAMTCEEPLRRAVRMALAQPCEPDAALSGGEQPLLALSMQERAALLLLDSLHLPPADAARWAELPEQELILLAHTARLKLIKNR